MGRGLQITANRFLGGGGNIISSCEDIANEIVGLATSRAVADGYGFNLVFLQHLLDTHRCFHTFIDRRMGEDGLMVKQIALCVEAHHLTTRAETRVNTHHPFLTQRCAQQQLAQVFCEDADGLIIGFLLTEGSKLRFDGGFEQTFVTILNRFCH